LDKQQTRLKPIIGIGFFLSRLCINSLRSRLLRMLWNSLVARTRSLLPSQLYLLCRSPIRSIREQSASRGATAAKGNCWHQLHEPRHELHQWRIWWHFRRSVWINRFRLLQVSEIGVCRLGV